MKLSPKQIEKVKNYFAKQKDIALVYLYGSFAYGNPHKRSDIDFGILFDKEIKDFHRLGQIYLDLCKLRLPAEPEVRNIHLRQSPVFLLNVIQGQLVFTSDEQKKNEFEVVVLQQYYDTQKLREIRYDYMQKRLKEGTYGY